VKRRVINSSSSSLDVMWKLGKYAAIAICAGVLVVRYWVGIGKIGGVAAVLREPLPASPSALSPADDGKNQSHTNMDNDSGNSSSKNTHSKISEPYWKTLNPFNSTLPKSVQLLPLQQTPDSASSSSSRPLSHVRQRHECIRQIRELHRKTFGPLLGEITPDAEVLLVGEFDVGRC